jgi:hypothetical protein
LVRRFAILEASEVNYRAGARRLLKTIRHWATFRRLCRIAFESLRLHVLALLIFAADAPARQLSAALLRRLADGSFMAFSKHLPARQHRRVWGCTGADLPRLSASPPAKMLR